MTPKNTTKGALSSKERGRLWRFPSQQSVLLWVGVGLLGVLIALPLGWLIVGSLRTDSPGFPSDWTLENYGLLFTDSFARLFQTSMIIAVSSTAMSVTLGLILAFIMVRTKVPMPQFMSTIVMVPAFITPFIGALGWTLLASPKIGYFNSWLGAVGIDPMNIYSIEGIIWVIGLYNTPIAYLYLRPALSRIDFTLEESARVLGASKRTVFFRILLPLLRPALVSSTLVVFVASAAQFGVPGLLGQPYGIEVIPTALMRMVTKFPSDPNGAAVLGVALSVVTLFALWIGNRILKRRDYTAVGGKGAQAARRDIGRWKYLTGSFLGAYLALTLVLPIGVMLISSFQPFLSTNIFNTTYSFANYEYVLTFPTTLRSITNSLWLAAGASFIGVLLSVILAYIIVRSKHRFRSVLDYTSTAPLAIPDTVFGLGMMWAWISLPIGVYGSPWILLLAYVGIFLPYAMRSTIAAFMQLDASLEDAGRVLGGSWILVVRRIIGPLLLPALLSGFIIIFYHAIRELAASLMLYSTGNETMAVVIWDLYIQGRFAELFALAMINIAITFIAAFALMRLGRDRTAV